MAQSIYDGTLEHDKLSDRTIHARVEQLRKHPDIEKIFTPVVRGVHHYKARVEVSKDGMVDVQVGIHAVMMTVPLGAGFCLERWKQAVDALLEKKCMGFQDLTSYVSCTYWKQISTKFLGLHLQET
jgi:hypothetical protein